MVTTISWRQLAMDALTKAEKIRRDAGIKTTDPVNVIDLAERRGLQVRFQAIPGLSGLYNKQRKLILLSSLRPSGKQMFSCAHEMGHDVYGHGSSVSFYEGENVVNQLDPKRNRPEEYQVNRFASFLLMPKVAVANGFVRRCWSPKTPSPEQVFIVAGWLGVGYDTLIHHMQSTLQLISPPQADRLRKQQPKNIRAKLFGAPISNNLVVVDREWTGRPVDIQVGDFVFAPKDISYEGSNAEIVEVRNEFLVLRGTCAGIGKFADNDWATFLRVSKREFVGLASYRHWEDPDDEVENA